MSNVTNADAKILDELDATAARLGKARDAVRSVIFGQDNVIDLALTAILGGGHALLVGAPGLAKTKLAITLGTVPDDLCLYLYL